MSGQPKANTYFGKGGNSRQSSSLKPADSGVVANVIQKEMVKRHESPRSRRQIKSTQQTGNSAAVGTKKYNFNDPFGQNDFGVQLAGKIGKAGAAQTQKLAFNFQQQ